jgi:Xaa-Pro dipeptidase
VPASSASSEHLAALYGAHVQHLLGLYSECLGRLGFDAIVIHAGRPKPRSVFDDQYFPLRPTPHFHHWVPLNEADAAVVLRPGKRPQLLRPRVKSFWERPAPLEAEFLLEPFEVHSFDEGTAPIDVLPRGGRVAFLGESAEAASAWGFASDAVNPAPLLKALDALRVRKTPYEIACLAEANRRAARGHEAVFARFRAGGASELDLHLAYLAATEQDDQETPYKNIVAKNVNASILHHVAYGRSRAQVENESLLLDAGATFLGYCSDITRTWIRGSEATATSFQGLIEGLERLQLELCDAAAHGLPYESLHDECHNKLGTLLTDVGLLRTTADEAVSLGITRVFLPHGLGHSLGLQCHDVGCAVRTPRPENPFLRNTSDIDAHQTFTIEPGVYFIDALLKPLREGQHSALVDWKLVDALAPFGGVRIEDDLHVRAAGTPHRNLTREFLSANSGAV